MKYKNRLKVLKEIKKGKYIFYTCLCECGTIKDIRKTTYDKMVFSCGCLRKELNRLQAKKNIKHGKCGTTEYKIWQNMKSRCNNTNVAEYKNYGGRGIKISKEWDSFENFFKDMGYRPSLLHTLDRIDNDKGYNKNNCRWVTGDIQHNNKRSNKYYELDGERKTIYQWANKLRIKPNTLVYRLRRGKPFKEAIR